MEFKIGDEVFMNFHKKKISIPTRIKAINNNYRGGPRYTVELMSKWFSTDVVTKEPAYKVERDHREVIIPEDIDDWRY